MFLLPFLLGLSTSYLGTITPSMLTVTAAKITLTQNKKTALNYALGVCLIVLFQVTGALFLLKLIRTTPLLITILHLTSIFILSLLSFYFFRKAIQNKKKVKFKTSSKNGFRTGIGLSFINMFSIPFYYGIVSLYSINGWFILDISSVFTFVIGATLGTYLILHHYIYFAKKLNTKLPLIITKIDFILGYITGLFAVVSFLNLL